MDKKVIIGVIAAGVLVAGVIGIIVLIDKNNRKSTDIPSNGPIMTTTKSIEALCSATLYEDTCKNTLSHIVSTGANSTDVIRTAVNATLAEVRAALQKSGNLRRAINDTMDQLAVKGCDKLLDYAIWLLETAFEEAASSEGLGIKARDLNKLLGGVIRFRGMCLDEIKQSELKEELRKELMNLTQLSSIALSIAARLALASDVVEGVGFNRRLLSSDQQQYYERDEDGFPSWLSDEERRVLLGCGGKSPAMSPTPPPPNAVVAQDGTGNFRTINDALKAVPNNFQGRYVIYVKAGVYKEIVTVTMPNLTMYGDGPEATIVTGDLGFPKPTYDTPTFAVVKGGNGFSCKDMQFRNTAGPQGKQAVALLVIADNVAFFNCRMDGYQDTVAVEYGDVFFYGCSLYGTIDFIFGDAFVIFQNCEIHVRLPAAGQQCVVAASGRYQSEQMTAIVIHNCTILPEPDLLRQKDTVESYLARPWKPFSRTIIMESNIGEFIKPEGYLPWTKADHTQTLYFGEYANTGPRNDTSARVKWPGVKAIGREEAIRYTVEPFLMGREPPEVTADADWLKNVGVPYWSGLMN